MNKYFRVLAVSITASTAACTGAHQWSTALPHAEIQATKQGGIVAARHVTSKVFADMLAHTPRGKVMNESTTIHITDGQGLYILPATATIRRTASGTDITIGHRVLHLSSAARVVGHGIRREFAKPSHSQAAT